jgi:hypothetical protein
LDFHQRELLKIKCRLHWWNKQQSQVIGNPVLVHKPSSVVVH